VLSIQHYLVDIIAGQGTVALEMEEQYNAMRRSEEIAKQTAEEKGNLKVKLKEAKDKEEFNKGMDGWFETWKEAQSKNGFVPQDEHHDAQASQPTNGKPRAMCSEAIPPSTSSAPTTHTLDAVIAPLGGGGLLGGTATYFSEPSQPGGRKPLIFGAEPSFSGANDAELGLRSGKRVEHVSSLTIADGLRTPLGLLNWAIISDPGKVAGVYSVTESQIKDTMRLVFERMKLVVEPSGCVALAVVLFSEEFRGMVAERQRGEGGRGWDVGVVFSGGNTTMEAIVGLYGGENREREEGTVGRDGKREVEDVAG
jgi:threonine dehydratase